jgi:hypothetical protein
MFMDLFSVIVLVFLGYTIGETIALIRFRKLLIKIAQTQGIDLEKEMEKALLDPESEDKADVEDLKVEAIQNTLYLYYQNDEFVCQGSSLDELAELAKKYKNIEWATVVHDKEVYMFMDGKVEKFKDENKHR